MIKCESYKYIQLMVAFTISPRSNFHTVDTRYIEKVITINFPSRLFN